MDILVALLNNAALLLVLSVIFEAADYIPSRYRRFQPAFSGILIAIVCAAVMIIPLKIESGIIFDTRSILISVTALIFGHIPTLITVIVATAVRIFIGGAGTLAGLATITTSALIGLAWRRWIPKLSRFRWLNIFVMSVVVHIVMLTCMLLLQSPNNLSIIRKIAMPIMFIYPIATVMLSLLLIRQQKHKRTQEQLVQSEERFKILFDKAPLGYQSLDYDGNFLEINQQWCDLFGYTRDEVIGRSFIDFLSPADKESFPEIFFILKTNGHIHSEIEVLSKNGKQIFISFEGKIGYGLNGEFKQIHCILQDITAQKAAENALIESEQKYRSIAENMSDIVWQSDLNLTATYVSFSVEKILGDLPEEHIRKKLEDKFSEQTLIKILSILSEEMEKEKDPESDKNRSRTIEVEQIKADGTAAWLELNVSFRRDMQGNPIGFLGISRDITQRKLAEIALHESERSKSILLSNIPGLAYRCNYDPEWTMQFVSEGCFELTGYTAESLLHNRDLSFNDLISPEHREILWNEWIHILANRLQFKYEYEIITASGERKWVFEIGQGVYNTSGEVEAMEGIILDISDRKNMENHLRYINEHDKWTGLYNRDYLEFLLDKDTKKCDILKRALININLSTVQLLTANYGFHYTQSVIKKAAESLSQYCTDNLLLFQTYENRFVFYIRNYNNKKELVDLCESISDSLEALLATERIGGGIGVLEIEQSDSEINVDLLLRRLLIASERSIAFFEKDFGICFYNEDLEALVNREGDIRQSLSAIAADNNDGELFLHYQPIYNLKTDTVVCFEALARLKTASLGSVPPSEFIPIAEKTKLIIPIGEKIIIKALNFLKKLNQNGYKDISISINISIIQLLKHDFTSRLFELIDEMQVSPNKVCIEITESVFSFDYENINHILEGLRQAGLKTAIDDFGTGYSSLAREKELSVDSLKIDKYFIDKLIGFNPNEVITGDIISMAHKLGHTVIAEGVEYISQLKYLKENNCDMVQGYLISKPLAEEDALSFMKTHSSSNTGGVIYSEN